jgi:hypothetical protein
MGHNIKVGKNPYLILRPIKLNLWDVNFEYGNVV